MVGLIDAAEDSAREITFATLLTSRISLRRWSQIRTRCWWRNKTNKDTENHVA